MELNERIAAARRAAGTSREQLGEALGVSCQAVSKRESGLSLSDVGLLLGGLSGRDGHRAAPGRAHGGGSAAGGGGGVQRPAGGGAVPPLRGLALLPDEGASARLLQPEQHLLLQ